MSREKEMEPLWPEPIDLRKLMATAPTPPRMIIDDWVPCGYATLLAGHGGAGKSSIALHLAVCIATGRPWWGLHCAMRRVLYLSGEDRADVLHWRLAHIADRERLEAADLSGLHVVDLVGRESILYRRDPKRGPILTAAYGELERLMSETRAEVLIVDGAADTFGASENDRAEVKAFVNHLVRLVGLDGAAIIVAHVNKPTAAASATAEGYSGSTQWHNAVRARWYLYPETEQSDDGREPTGNLILALQKSNLGRDDQSMTFRWNQGARMFIAEATAKRIGRAERDEAEQRGIVRALRSVMETGDYCPAATMGRRTAYHVLSAAEGFPESLQGKPNVRRFWRHIEALRRMRVIREGSITRKDRHIVCTLELEPASNGTCGHAGNA